MIKTRCEVRVYEIDGEETAYESLPIIVEAHWNSRDRIVITVPGAKPVTVLVADLEAAIRAAWMVGAL